MFAAATSQSNPADVVFSLIFVGTCVLAALIAYFLPTFVAGIRGHQNTTAIAVLNILLGWTFVVWVIALVWAFTEVHHKRYRRYSHHR